MSDRPFDSPTNIHSDQHTNGSNQYNHDTTVDDSENLSLALAIEESLHIYKSQVQDLQSQYLVESLLLTDQQQQQYYRQDHDDTGYTNVNDGGMQQYQSAIYKSNHQNCNHHNHTKRQNQLQQHQDQDQDDHILQSTLSESLIQSLITQDQIEMQDEQLASALQESTHLMQRHKLHTLMNAYLTNLKLKSTEEHQLGSWDCIHCTLVNKPYSPFCDACGHNPPPHILTFKPIPQSLRYGIEIEIVIPFGNRDGYTLQSIAKNLTKACPDVPVLYCGYTHETINGWKIVTDSSIQPMNPHNQDLTFELVSPVLQGDAGLESFRKMMANVRSLGIATNRSCGFHMHVDATTTSIDSSNNNHQHSSMLGNLNALKSLCKCFVSLENAFDLIVALSWSGGNDTSRRTNQNQYCRSNRIQFGQQSNKQRWNTISNASSVHHLVQLMNPNRNRYHKLNLTNLINRDRPSTCEFRHHGGVQEIQEAEAWIRFILLFCQSVVLDDIKRDACLLHEGATTFDELRALFDLVGCQGLEQLFTIDKRLYVESDLLRNEWKCRVCRRTFKSSRSFAQHQSASGH